MKNAHILGLVLAFTLGSANAGTCPSKVQTVAKAKMDIVDTAVKAGSFNTLVAALKAGGLVEALKGDGPFTVFAPTDEAFDALPEGTVETLLKPENKEKLVSILTYHVVPDKVASKDVVGLDSAESLNGQRIPIGVKGHDVSVAGAPVVKTDIATSNGVIHVIGKVMMPADSDIVQTAAAAGTFGTLLAAAKAAGLAEALGGDGPYTVFAPTDEAFEKLPDGTVDELLKPESKEKLAAILKYHVVPGRVYANQAIEAGKATTLEGSDISIQHADGAVKIDDAQVTKADIDTSNGVIHIIDTVILPN